MLNHNITDHVTYPITLYTVNHKRTDSMDWRGWTAKKERKTDRMNERRTPSIVCIYMYIYIVWLHDPCVCMFKRPIEKKESKKDSTRSVTLINSCSACVEILRRTHISSKAVTELMSRKVPSQKSVRPSTPVLSHLNSCVYNCSALPFFVLYLSWMALNGT